MLCFFSFLLNKLLKLIQEQKQFFNIQKLIKTNKCSFGQYYEFGILLLNKRFYSEASKYFKIAISKCNDILLLGNLYNNLGYCYFKENKLKQAEFYYLKALKYIPDYTVALNNLAFLYKKQRLFKISLEYYEKSYNLDPNNLQTQKQYNQLKNIKSK